MEKVEIVGIITRVLKPIDFRRRGNNWVNEAGEIIKIVNLQKSVFGNRFYINYGFIVRCVPLIGAVMHVFNGLENCDDGGLTSNVILDLDIEIPDLTRAKRLEAILAKCVVTEMTKVNTERDIKESLENRLSLNDIPLNVKEYFGFC